MKRTLTVALSLVLLTTLAAPAGAQAIRTPFTSHVVTDDILDPGTVRVTSGGVLILRGQVSSGTDVITIEGVEYTGTLTLTTNVNLNLKSSRGSVYGTYTLEVPNLDTWTGNVQGVIEGGLASGTFVGHGVDGTKQMGTVIEGPGPGVFDVEGVILAAPGLTN